MKLSIRVADPAGNITIFVMSETPPSQYAAVASRLLSLPEYGAEQVAFQVSPRMGGDGRIQMMGGEFCGNATRSYGCLLSTLLPGTPDTVLVEISGAESPLSVLVDRQGGQSETEMPLPTEMVTVPFDGETYDAVCFDGIIHTIVPGVPRGQKFCDRLLQALRTALPASAYGILFLEGDRMTPLVYVCETDSMIWERSCGSGSMAVAALRAVRAGDGEHRYALCQPGGVIEATATVENGTVVACRMGGPVTLSEEISLELQEI